MKANLLAKWFMKTNPSLKNGYIDENTKLNKLLFFSSSMYYATQNENLTDEKFEKWDNGPVIRKIYTDYRYNNLSSFSDSDIVIEDDEILKILNIINIVYGDMDAKTLSHKSHESLIWKNAQRNEELDFSNMSEEERNFMTNVYQAYKGLDFENLRMEKINGNRYFYFQNNIKDFDEDLIKKLETVPTGAEPSFIELIDGEYVFS